MLDEIKAGIPSHVSADLTARPQATAAELRERMSGNICRCGAYSNIVDAITEVAGRQSMKSFTYERAQSPDEAAAAAARTQGAKFIAGGTNLLDLMKLEIETPTHLIDVNGLALDKIEATPKAACASARWCATPISPPMSACGATMACSRARCSPALRANCATRRRPRAICFSAPAVLISTTPISPATNASPAAAARRSAASAASTRSSA